jgi:hypothetical protein
MNKAKVKEKAAQMLALFGPNGRGWAKGDLAYVVTRGGRGRNKDAGTCRSDSEQAKSWCLLGAAEKLWPNRKIMPVGWLVAAVRQYAGLDISVFNDTNDWRRVKDFLTQLKKHGCIVKKALKQ